MLILLSFLALAGDPQPVQKGETVRAREKSWLLTENQFNTCLSKAQQLDEVSATLEDTIETTTTQLLESQEAIVKLDRALFGCTDRSAQLILDKKDLEAANKRLRGEKAYLIGGGVLLTAVAVLEAVIILKK
jgi:hypothetical protein